MRERNLTRERFTAYTALAAGEPVFARLIGQYGQPDPFEWFDGGRTGDSKFAAMVLHIVGQQISARVAFTVYDRLAAARWGVPTPESVAELGPQRLRGCGVSTAKAGYLLALADSQTAGAFDIEHLDQATDADAIAALTAVRGIGVWSAETFLVHNLRRPDVLPAGDLGVRRAVSRLWQLEPAPSEQTVRDMALAWTPWRSYAGALLWRSLASPNEPSDPKRRALQTNSPPA